MIVLKVYDAHHASPGVHKILELPCTLGRSVHSSVVIDHPSISLEHAVIEESPSGPVLRDLRSTNGIFYQDRKITELPLGENLSFFMGPVRVEVLVNDPDLEKTQEFSYEPSRMAALNRRSPLRAFVVHLVVTVSIALSAVLEYFMLSYDKKKDSAYASFFGALVLTYGFAFLASVGAKIHSKRYHFTEMTAYSSAFVLYLVFYHLFSDAIVFNLQAWFDVSVGLIVLSCAIYAWIGFRIALVILPHASRVKLLRNAVILMTLISSAYFAARSLLDSESQRFEYYGAIGVPYIETGTPARVNLDPSARVIARFREEVASEKREEEKEGRK